MQVVELVIGDVDTLDYRLQHVTRFVGQYDNDYIQVIQVFVQVLEYMDIQMGKCATILLRVLLPCMILVLWTCMTSLVLVVPCTRSGVCARRMNMPYARMSYALSYVYSTYEYRYCRWYARTQYAAFMMTDRQIGLGRFRILPLYERLNLQTLCQCCIIC